MDKPNMVCNSTSNVNSLQAKKASNNMNMSFGIIARESLKNPGEKYYIANHLPKFSLDFGTGYVFFVFTSEEFSEEIQIGSLDEDTLKTSKYYISHENGVDTLKFKIYPKIDSDGKKYFVGTLRLPAQMTFFHDPKKSSMMVFTSVEGKEEIQLQGNLVHYNK